MTQNEFIQIDLMHIWHVIWNEKFKIIILTSLIAVLTMVYALSLPDKFKAEVLIIPQNSSGGSDITSMANQLGGLASFAGLNLSGGADDTLINIERIKSKEFIYKLVTKYNMKIPLVAGKEWNKVTNKLIINDKIYDVNSSAWIRPAEPNKSVIPTNFEAYERFIENLEINQDKVNGTIKIQFEFLSPVIAKEWVDAIVIEINESLRQEKIRESKVSIAYLEKQLLKTNVAEMKNVFYNLIQEQSKAMLLAEVQLDYAFKIIDSAVIPETKSGPRRATICIIGTIIGGFISLLLILMINFFKKDPLS